MPAPAPLPASPPAAFPDACATLRRLEEGVARVIHGKPDAIRLAVTALAARGHVLVEDVPGVGKTTLARALARAIGGSFRRVQFTADLLPSDILGSSVWRPEQGDFEFKPGPIFANVVLADEINRTPPRTQSALLEAMGEARVSVDGATHALPRPFLVVATQNPLEHFGTYPLPESQMDRFLLRLRLGYPDAGAERQVVTNPDGIEAVDQLPPVVSLDEVAACQRAAAAVRVDESLLGYAERLVRETRKSPLFTLGVSPRGFQSWYRAAQARALVLGRDYAVPDDLKALALPVLAHRVLLTAGGGGEPLGRTREEAERALTDILQRLTVPA